MHRKALVGLLLVVLLVASYAVPFGRTASAAPRAQDEENVTGVEGSSYTSPSFGYSISWDREWEVSDELNDEEYNKLVLDNGTASVYIEGLVDPSSTAECVETIVQTLEQSDGVEDVGQMDEDGELVGGSEDGRDWAVYNFTYSSDDGSIDFSQYIDCRPIVEGESLLVITMLTQTEDFGGQVESLVALLDELSLEGETGGPTDQPDDTTGNQPAEGDLAEWVVVSGRDINAFWEREFPRISDGEQYEAPADVVPFDTAIETACGPAAVMEIGPFYCPPDRVVYYDVGFAQLQVDNFGNPSVIAVVMAHEIGHHVQNLMQWSECEQTPCLDPAELTSQEFELMADCFAGAWIADAETRGRMGSFDIETNITQFAVLLGDQGIGNTADPGAHGKAASRVYWLLTGYFFGVSGCLEISAATDPARNGGTATSQPEEDPTPEATEEATAEPTDEATEEPTEEATTGEPAQIGDEVTLELRDQTLTLEVSETELTGSVAEDIEAEGQFLVVYVTVERDADAPGPLPYNSFVVTDSDGNEYRLDEAATDELLRTAFPEGIDENLDLGASYNIAFVFDVDPDASGFIFSTSSGEGAVELDV